MFFNPNGNWVNSLGLPKKVAKERSLGVAGLLLLPPPILEGFEPSFDQAMLGGDFITFRGYEGISFYFLFFFCFDIFFLVHRGVAPESEDENRFILFWLSYD